MIVIGVDIHKRTHTLVAVNTGTGVQRGQLTIAASDAGHADALRFARDLDDEIVWALEDCRHVSGRLERALVSAGEHVIRVWPTLMGASRKGERQPGKSDPIDALAVARAVVRYGVDAFPAAYLNEDAMEIRLLHDHREHLVDERTRQGNRLRVHLLALDPVLEAEIPMRGLDQPVNQNKIRRRLTKLKQTARVRIARRQLAQITALSREILELHNELDTLTTAQNPQLRRELGIGPVTAAILIGQTAGAQRFATDAKFARQAGTAPIPASSGKTQRHRLHRGGNRQLNKAIHIIALVRARCDPRTRAYLDRKRAEGKTGREAMRCLKRHLARLIWRLLYTNEPPPLNPAPPRPSAVAINALNVMPCLS